MTHNEKVLSLLSDGCVLWTGYVTPQGYGSVHRGGRPKQAHRYVYELNFGSIPKGYEIHHRCKNRACVNLEHLQLVTRLEHRAIERAERTHCKRGHSFAEYGRNHRGRASIYCTLCKREADRRRAAAKLYQLCSEGPSAVPHEGAAESPPSSASSEQLSLVAA